MLRSFVVSNIHFSHLRNNHDGLLKAPTGSGKTVLFELGIIRLLSKTEQRERKCVYMAPTKVIYSLSSKVISPLFRLYVRKDFETGQKNSVHWE